MHMLQTRAHIGLVTAGGLISNPLLSPLEARMHNKGRTTARVRYSPASQLLASYRTSCFPANRQQPQSCIVKPLARPPPSPELLLCRCMTKWLVQPNRLAFPVNAPGQHSLLLPPQRGMLSVALPSPPALC